MYINNTVVKPSLSLFLNMFKGPVQWMKVEKCEEKQLYWLHWQDVHDMVVCHATQESLVLLLAIWHGAKTACNLAYWNHTCDK